MNFKICKNVRRDQLEHLMEERGKTQKVNYTTLKNNSVTSSLTRCLSTGKFKLSPWKNIIKVGLDHEDKPKNTICCKFFSPCTVLSSTD